MFKDILNIYLVLLADANSEVDQYKLDKTSLRELQDLQERENWKEKIIRKFNVPKIDFIDSCSTFIDDDKENIKEEKSEIDTMTTVRFVWNCQGKAGVYISLSLSFTTHIFLIVQII